ncbi:MAG TPA: hypothetical protein PKY96_10650 [Flavobacteriales bacterium]|nr:hypothetical protein [Flavobacteriales bacterium]
MKRGAFRSEHGAAAIFALLASGVAAQTDTLLKHIALDEVVISAQADGFDVNAFVQRVRTDTTFHKAFLNTRTYPHTVRSEAVVRRKDERESASVHRRARLVRAGKSATLAMDSVSERGKLRDRKGRFRYLTIEMYDDVFFPKGSFPADNTVAGRRLEVERGSRFEKYKGELKKFMFDPGTEIASVPFIGRKLALFSPEMAPLYDFRIWSDSRGNRPCWVFSAAAKPEHRDGRTVIKTMDTWFDQETGDVLARSYRIAHSAIFLDFDISISVRNIRIGDALVPVRVSYDGDWDIPFEQRELVRFWLEYSDWKTEP